MNLFEISEGTVHNVVVYYERVRHEGCAAALGRQTVGSRGGLRLVLVGRRERRHKPAGAAPVVL